MNVITALTPDLAALQDEAIFILREAVAETPQPRETGEYSTDERELLISGHEA